MADCKVHLVIVLAFFLTAQTASAKNLGSIGNTYPVVEPNVIEEVKAGIDHATLSRIMTKPRERYQPTDLYSLPVAMANRTFYPDMTHTLEYDIPGENGEIIYKKGLTWNPLNFVTLRGGMVVINGEDEEQIQWFEKSPYFKNLSVKLLISGGYAVPLVKQLNRPVFYLTRTIADRLQLAAVPSIILQEGNKMMVREVRLEK